MKMNIVFLLALIIFLVDNSYGQDCLLTVPQNPLSATGLATPYKLSSKDSKTPCSQTGDGASFVQGAVLDIDTGKISVYNPLVIDAGTRPAVAPVVPNLPRHSVVGLWFGTNGDSLTLVDDGSGSLGAGNCINGINGSIFGQFSYCNAPNFFLAFQFALVQSKITIPALGTAKDGQPCPTTRDFFIIDQDQSDNVVTTYLITPSGRLASNTALNRRNLPNSTVLSNGSDEALLVAVDNALGCTPWLVPDLADTSSNLASLPMNELLANYRQEFPVALVPSGDPMVLDNDGAMNLQKLNLYRFGVGQSIVQNLADADTVIYCKRYARIFLKRMVNPTVKKLLQLQPSPDPAVGTNLYTFLAGRFASAFGKDNLNCTGLLGLDVPISNKLDETGVVDDVTILPATADSSLWAESSSTSIYNLSYTLIAFLSLSFTMLI